jgi:hypothetical protein
MLNYDAEQVLDKVLIGLFVGIFCAFYLIMLFAELWPIRKDMVDVKHHFWGSLAGLCVVVVSMWVVEGGSIGRSIDWEAETCTPWVAATICTGATIFVIGAHFIFTDGHLIYLSLFRRYDMEILKEYYDEYAIDKEHGLQESMLNFDTQVRMHRETLQDHSLAGRLARQPHAGRHAAKPVHAARRCSEAIKHLVSPHGHRLAQTAAGKHVHQHAYHREQFGVRRKLHPDTMVSMGRHPHEHAHRRPVVGRSIWTDQYGQDHEELRTIATVAVTGDPTDAAWQKSHPYAAQVTSAAATHCFFSCADWRAVLLVSGNRVLMPGRGGVGDPRCPVRRDRAAGRGPAPPPPPPPPRRRER